VIRNHPAIDSARLQIQARLLGLAAIFLFLYCSILTIAPAARARSWNVTYNWSQWLAFLIWIAVFGLLHSRVRRQLPDSDPYLLPIAALLTGWGMLTIWRLQPAYGMRQAVWLLVSGLVVTLGLRLTTQIQFLRRYKYLWLTGGLLLTALTLIFGTNPNGIGPREWLGCCGVYFQPSEPLKLLLLVYLAAYLADHLQLNQRLIPLLAPTAFVTGLALLLLVVQRDLGTASIFIALYTITIYIASGKKRILGFALIALLLAGGMGYFLFDVVRLRVNAWINPWLDPAGRSFQIVQALISIANGGLIGRGPGMGSPSLVPVAISDFVFTAITEETGLMGAIGLILLVAILVSRGIQIALSASDSFRRLLAAGITVYLGGQTILIVGGNTRLLPLTGVTLPFVSYGGSSLLTAFLSLLLLLVISNRDDREPAPLTRPQPYLLTASLLGLGLLGLTLSTGWWAALRSPMLVARTDNARRTIADRYVRRGSLLDRNGIPISQSIGQSGSYQRVYDYPDLAAIVGYTNPAYGQSGLEASLDPYLRGLAGNPASLIWLDHLLYGQPPPGLNIRLSLDLGIQKQADSLLAAHAGAIVLINSTTGEVLVMASHPTFDPNQLNNQAQQLLTNPSSPLLNRAVQIAYTPGNALAPFYEAVGLSIGSVAQGTSSALTQLYQRLGFYTAPVLDLPTAAPSSAGAALRISPLQMALAAAAFNNGGRRPAPQIAMAVETPTQGWVVLPNTSTPVQEFSPTITPPSPEITTASGLTLWGWSAGLEDVHPALSWFIGGTSTSWQGAPLTIVVLLEEDAPSQAQAIGTGVLEWSIDH
jgi:cell division protein FtsW (lipid II flippase)